MLLFVLTIFVILQMKLQMFLVELQMRFQKHRGILSKEGVLKKGQTIISKSLAYTKILHGSELRREGKEGHSCLKYIQIHGHVLCIL